MKREDYRKACARRAEIRGEMAALQAKLAKENRGMTEDTMRTKHALRLNKTFVASEVAANAPKGPFVDIDEAHTITAAGALSTIKRDDFINLRSAVNGKSNVPVNNPAYLINWDTWAQLVNTPLTRAVADSCSTRSLTPSTASRW